MKRTKPAKKTGVAVLKLTTWKGSGTVWYAEHYYGRIKYNGEEDDLNYVLNAEQAEKLSEDDFAFKAGDESGRFFSEEAVMAAALEYCKEHDIKWLILGETSCCDPQKIILGADKKLKDKLNDYYAKAEEIDFWEKDEAQMQKIADAWIKLAAEHGIVEAHGSPNV